MKRFAILLFAAIAYAVFFASFVLLAGFVAGIGLLPKSIDHGAPAAIGLAGGVAIDIGLIALFGLPHSIMARRSFKRALTRFLPEAAERSLFVLVSSLLLLLLMWQWRPLPDIVWQVASEPLAWSLMALSAAGWLLVLASSFAIDHFELFGLRQAWHAFRGTTPPATAFRTPVLYRIVRHPLYLGFLLAFWATPTMSLGHLVFAAGMSVYILIGTMLEERDLVARFGAGYRDYAARVPMLVPGLRRKTPD